MARRISIKASGDQYNLEYRELITRIYLYYKRLSTGNKIATGIAMKDHDDSIEDSRSQSPDESGDPGEVTESRPATLYRRSVLGAAAGFGMLLTGGAAAAAGRSEPEHDDETPPGRERKEVELGFLGRYSSGVFDEGAAEIVDYDPDTERLFVVNGNADAVDVLDASDPANPTKADRIDTSKAFGEAGGPNSLDIRDEQVVVAIENADPQSNGRVAVYDTESLGLRGTAEVGSLPDLVTFTPNGRFILTADEGEPSGYRDSDSNPKGSISVVDVSDGIAEATVETAGFEKFNSQREDLIDEGVRIYGPGASVAEDLEPEYITVDQDSKTAWVTLQENNALAVVDVVAAEVTDIVALGYKDFSEPGNGLDAVDDGEIDITTQPLFGMYQPDTIASFQARGETFLVTANEGDTREAEDFPGFNELTTVGDFRDKLDDPDEIPEELDELEVTNRPPGFDYEKVDAGSITVERPYAIGARSFAIWSGDGDLVFESGDAFEQIAADADREGRVDFNADDNENGRDAESPASGPEPEGIAVGRVAGEQYAFIGLEEIGGIIVFKITNPEDREPEFIQYINTRDFSVDPETAIEEGTAPADAAGDLAPEGLSFISEDDSPIDDALLAVGFEVSGTTSLFKIENISPDED
jgi:hypothetical protein